MARDNPHADKLWTDVIRSSKITTDMLMFGPGDKPILAGDKVSAVELFGDGRQPYDVALDNAAKKLLERIEGAGLEPDMGTLEVTTEYDPNFVRDRVIVTAVAR